MGAHTRAQAHTHTHTGMPSGLVLTTSRKASNTWDDEQ